MKYKLYDNGTNDTGNIIKEILKNRGVNDYNTYLNLDKSILLPYEYLENIDKAVEMFTRHFNSKDKIGILVDSDPDGYCSAAIMYMYIKRLDKNYPVSYILHEKTKAHGLSNDVIIPENVQFLIIPDSATNDVKECKKLKDRKLEILILDHHEREKENPYALVVNNQSSERYTNKNLCGAGVVYRFLQALDSEYWTEYADDYLDLVALANISDVMDMRSFETRYLVNVGLLNIKNKFFKAIIEAQNYSMNGKVNIHNVQWFITPVLNGCIRVGSLEDKELLFRAFIETDESFEYKKRATKDKPSETIQENIYDRAARLCKNAKARQDKLKEKSVAQIVKIAQDIVDNNKVIMLDVSDILDSGLTGVVAIKIADTFHKPCILLKKHLADDEITWVYGGSARNINHSPIESFKDVVNSTGIINAQGHANAFGLVDFPINKKDEAINTLNDILKDIDYDSTYKVDFILSCNDISISLIMEMAKFEDITGQGIEEPIIAVENISLTRDCFEIFGKNEDTISFYLNEIKYIQFKCKEDNPLYEFLQDAWDDNDRVTFNIVGKPSINEFGGIRIPQIIIEDVTVLSTSSNEEDEW